MHVGELAADIAELCYVTPAFVQVNTVASHELSLFSQAAQRITVMRDIKSLGFVLFLSTRLIAVTPQGEIVEWRHEMSWGKGGGEPFTT